MSPTRRGLLQGLAGASALYASRGWAFGEASLVDVAELDLGSGTLTRPNAWKRLLYEADVSTSVGTASKVVRVQPEDPGLFEHPYAVLVGDGPFAAPSDAAAEQLAQYLSYGGFLFVDDASGGTSAGFDASVRALCGRLFPTRPLAPLPANHAVLRSFFLLNSVAGRVDRQAFLEGITVATLCPLVYSRNDVSGALDQDDLGRYSASCVPGGEAQRRTAVKVALNTLMYALTANYKNDQAHVRQLMLERRLK